MLTKIKQFVFSLGYEFTLFQKITAGLLGLFVVGFLGLQAGTMLTNIGGKALQASVVEDGGEGGETIALNILNVDQSGLAAEGTLAVKYALSTKPGSALAFILTVTSNEVEIGRTESESLEQAGTLTASIDPPTGAPAPLTIRITAQGGGLSLSDTVTIILGPSIPLTEGPSTSTGAILSPSPSAAMQPSATPSPITPIPSGSGTLLPASARPTPSAPPPAVTGSGTLPSLPILQCRRIGRSCSQALECCSQRCQQVNISDPKVKVCLPKR